VPGCAAYRRRDSAAPHHRDDASLAQLHATCKVAFGWSDEHLIFSDSWLQFGDPARAIELALAGVWICRWRRLY